MSSADATVTLASSEASSVEVGILHLPNELILHIFFATDSIRDAVALSSTCKTLRSVYDHDCRIGMHLYPSAFELLNLQRPGATSVWRNAKLIEALERPQRHVGVYSFLDMTARGTLTVASLSPLRTFSGKEARDRLALNHTFITDLVAAHAKFHHRTSFSSIAGLRSLFSHATYHQARPTTEPQPQPRRRKVTLSPHERTRLIESCYLTAVLQLHLYSFAKPVSPQPTGRTHTLFNYAPLLALPLRQLLELMTTLRVLFVDADRKPRPLSQFRWDSCGPRKAGRGAIPGPLFETHDLRVALAFVVNLRTRLLGMFGLLGKGFRPLRYTEEFDVVEAFHHQLRSIFWDENQDTLTNLLKELDISITSSPDPRARACLPLTALTTDGEGMRGYVDVLNSCGDGLKMMFPGQYKLPPRFSAVRVDKDGVVMVGRRGIGDWEEEGGYWGVFRCSDLRRLQKGFWKRKIKEPAAASS
ncbi:hypothetical protein BJ508DRAFT_332430 [Ascobolus immersus RN42]|uniref:F-box domain-containing protein n=1 Tax=Ascobolus immersus RN42 TaxID=1160509 RepID=A0A3N4HTC7_ASCIM|nr:hypothetical protein BJ508DRAFT_332430 [Ascobolus immersus RN42]